MTSRKVKHERAVAKREARLAEEKERHAKQLAKVQANRERKREEAEMEARARKRAKLSKEATAKLLGAVPKELDR